MFSTVDTQARKPLRFAVTALAMAITLSTLIPLSAQADDLEIYQPSQTGGRKTLILMLDSSGNMSSAYNGSNKMDSVIDGMTAFLNSTDPKLNAVVVGLGHFNASKDDYDASGNHASILVPAAPLGAVGSAQRLAILSKLNKTTYFKPGGNSPLLNGYVEAAAYLMGTRTATPSACTTTAGHTTCTLTDTGTATTDESGMNSSVDAAKNLTDLTNVNYKSPLPLPEERLGCDGQGIYFLAGGGLNATANSTAVQMMSKALQNTDRTENTYCPTGYAGLTKMIPLSNMPWNCMAKFARTLYTAGENPSGVKIKSAFVGYGSDFVGLSSDPSINACHFGSNLKGQLCSTDGSPTLSNPLNDGPNGYNGYGNGGFYIATKKEDVTTSVLNFIENLGNDTVAPLVTGAPSVPIDDLNPNGFQPYGYLRMLEPNPAKATYLLWRGNLKKYKLSGGAMVSKGTTTPVLDTSGRLVADTTDMWNASTGDGGKIDEGGAYPKVPMPPTTTTPLTRPLFTDVASASGGVLTGISTTNTPLTAVPTSTTPTTSIPALFDATTGTAPFKDMSLDQKKVLINYLGYDLAMDATPIPTPLVNPASRFLSMGGSIHAQPIQLSYSSTLNSDGTLSTAADAREESVLYGTMEGALHLVDATSGVEQMAFVPKEILADAVQSKALRRGEIDGTSSNTPAQGVDGPWVADAAYKTSRSASKLTATRMNVYGGLRMGGSSYYGLDLFTKSGNTVTPKLLFRVGPDVTNYSEMGQSWSKPVLANVRYNDVITRVMIVGGGYDINYESSSYVPTTSAPAKGNTVYMVNAKTGALIWKATNANLIHSVPARVSPIDRDGDQLIDSIYFADLGGQVFRADFNNKYGTSTSRFSVRVTRLADLATSTQKSAGFNPRFYEAPTVSIFDQGSHTFALVGVASGNRSSPLDVLSVAEGGKALRTLPVNKVFGIIDRDVARPDLIKLVGSSYVNATGTPYAPATSDRVIGDLQQDPQVNLTGIIGDHFFATSSADTATKKDGWYRSLSSTSDGTEKANGTFRYPGGMKAFEEQIAITGKLYVPVYDPQGTGVTPGDACQPRVVGETDLQTFCLPYGVCMDGTGAKHATANDITGARFEIVNGRERNHRDSVIGPGIRGISLGDKVPSGAGGDCKSFTMVGNTSGLGEWNCKRKLVQTLWYEKQPNRNKVQ